MGFSCTQDFHSCNRKDVGQTHVDVECSLYAHGLKAALLMPISCSKQTSKLGNDHTPNGLCYYCKLASASASSTQHESWSSCWSHAGSDNCHQEEHKPDHDGAGKRVERCCCIFTRVSCTLDAILLFTAVHKRASTQICKIYVVQFSDQYCILSLLVGNCALSVYGTP